MTPWRILTADVLDGLAQLEDGSVQCCVTSPPYLGLRDYGVAGQIGLERTPEEYVTKLVAVFREVRRVLRDDGVLWLNLGDSYAGGGNGGGGSFAKDGIRTPMEGTDKNLRPAWKKGGSLVPDGLKPKDLVGVPWRVAFALQADGWWLRSDVIWAKPNPMPESVTDRPTKAHEYMFMLTKAARYYWDAAAVAEQAEYGRSAEIGAKIWQRSGVPTEPGRTPGSRTIPGDGGTRNLRTVWNIPTFAFPQAHFATFPPKLVEPCVKSSSREGDTVLDPFCGAGTTGLVANRLQRAFVGIELNPKYADMARARIRDDAPLLQETQP